MAENSPYDSKSYIKDIAFELPDYKFMHRPYDPDDKENFEFLGREHIVQQLSDILLNSRNNGAYLVSGYRGMGKSSFINRVLKDADTELRDTRRIRLRQVNVSFGRSDISYRDLLKQFISSLQQNVLSSTHRLMIQLLRPSVVVLIAVSCFLFFVFVDSLRKTIADLTASDGAVASLAVYGIVSVAIGFLVVKCCSVVLHLSPSIRIYNRLVKLYTRTSAEIGEEENIQSMVKNFNFGLFSKSTAKYPPLTAKEIELELIDIINRIDRTSAKPWRWPIWHWLNRVSAFLGHYRINMYVFVFDEMDKIQPGANSDQVYDAAGGADDNDLVENMDEQRRRKQVMVNIVSSMKNLLSGAHAKFIFIAGREMFEASLADIADRQFSLGSIFHKIIYVDSFLKDKQGSDPAGLSNLIENHLKFILLPKAFLEKWDNDPKKAKSRDVTFLRLYYELISGNEFTYPELDKEEVPKLIMCMQQFIIYLTYRTNGSPKKLTRLIEEFIVNGRAIQTSKPRGEFRNDVRIKSNSGKVERQRLFIYLSYENQYRFGFITYIYRPFLLNYNRQLKNFSDYLLVSTTYLVDHILKFHPLAFSTKNLELMPEVMSANRNPQLRNFIEDILQFLSHSYIRETETKLFDYKFFNKISNEVLHLTNLFEDESAAFNFTLDESSHIKMHIRNKIIELRRIHKDFQNGHGFLHSISSLNSLLGDLRYFDQEYNDAITAYSDGLRIIRSMLDDEKRGVEEVILMIQFELKLGLCYEKTKNYDNALAYYADSMSFGLGRMLDYYNDPEETSKSNTLKISVYELLQIVQQAFIANLYLIEKMSDHGVSLSVVEETYKSLNNIYAKMEKNKFLPSMARYHFFNQLSILFFYKNSYRPTLLERLPRCMFVDHEEFSQDDGAYYNFDKVRFEKSDFRTSNLSLYFSIISLHNLLDHFKRYTPIVLPGGQGGKELTSHTIKSAFYVALKLDYHRLGNRALLSCFGTIVSRIGDDLLASSYECSGRHEIHQLIPNEVFRLLETKHGIPDYKDQMYEYISHMTDQGLTHYDNRRVVLTISCYLLSARFFWAARKMSQCTSQLKRVLKVVDSLVRNPDDQFAEERNSALKHLERFVFKEILRALNYNSNSTDRAQIIRYKHYLGIDDSMLTSSQTRIIFNNLSNNPEIREAIVLFARINVKCRRITETDYKKPYDLLVEQSIVLPANIIAFQWTRAQELHFQADLNWKINHEYYYKHINIMLNAGGKFDDFCDIWTQKLFPLFRRLERKILDKLRESSYLKDDYLKGIATDKADWITDSNGDLWEFYAALHAAGQEKKEFIMDWLQVICNSIHSLQHTIEILQTYGSNYPAGFVFIGDLYKKMLNWVKLYYLGMEINSIVFNNEYDLRSRLEFMVGVEQLRGIEEYALAQTAVINYRKALELHHEGSGYKTNIQVMNYLDDDFNDTVDHFAAALERQLINCGKVRDDISKLETFLANTQMYRYDAYVNLASPV